MNNQNEVLEILNKIIKELKPDAMRMAKSKRRGDSSMDTTLSYAIRLAENAIKYINGETVENPRDILMTKAKRIRDDLGDIYLKHIKEEA